MLEYNLEYDRISIENTKNILVFFIKHDEKILEKFLRYS